MEGSDGGRSGRGGVCPIRIIGWAALKDLHVGHFLRGEEQSEKATPIFDCGAVLVGDFAVG
jgi:hypothetical protein